MKNEVVQPEFELRGGELNYNVGDMWGGQFLVIDPDDHGCKKVCLTSAKGMKAKCPTNCASYNSCKARKIAQR
jgi:hypothetical protein